MRIEVQEDTQFYNQKLYDGKLIAIYVERDAGEGTIRKIPNDQMSSRLQ